MFRYKAIDLQGKIVHGVVDVTSAAELEARLKTVGLELISGQQVKQFILPQGRKRITRRDLITFCFHLEQQVKAGVPLLESLQDLQESVDNPGLRSITASLVQRIESGASLSQALEDFPYAFDSIFVSLIRAGEKSGKLLEVLQTLSENLKWQDEIVSQSKKALTYPVFVGISVVGVVVALMVFLVPELVKFISTMNKVLPFHTQALIWVSDTIRHHGEWIFMAIAGTVASVGYLNKASTKFAYLIDKLKLNVWVVGPIIRKLKISRFAHHFALLYQAGITVPECLQISEGIVGNRVLAEAIRRAGGLLEQGRKLSESFEATDLFPRLVLRMLRVGETTGELDTALLNISYFYNRDVKDSMEKMQALIGPTMTVTLGIILAWVIISVMGPIYDSLTNVTF